MNSISSQLPRGEQLIINFLSENGGEFSRPQKYMAKAIGYRRDYTNELLQQMLIKGLIAMDYRIGVDSRLKVISLVGKGEQANG